MTFNAKVWSMIVAVTVFVWSVGISLLTPYDSLLLTAAVWISGFYVGAMAIPTYREYTQHETIKQWQAD